MNNYCFKILILAVIFLNAAASAFASPPERIVSLAPQITEILYALGIEGKVVGVTDFCDYPPEAKGKPKIGGMSNPSLEAVFSLKPDMVVMSTDGNPKEFQIRLGSLGIETFVFDARRVRELPDALRDMGHALGAGDKAEELAAEIEKTLQGYAGVKSPSRYKIAFVVWPEPLMVAGPGTAADDAIKILGNVNIAGEAPSSYPRYSVEELIRAMPDYIVFGGGHSEMKKLSFKLLEKLKGTPAAREGNVFYVGDGLFRLGPRTVEGIKELERIFEGRDKKK